ncbi:hypothetical protein GCM10027053_12240 [Intrasporangium mesophilum]
MQLPRMSAIRRDPRDVILFGKAPMAGRRRRTSHHSLRAHIEVDLKRGPDGLPRLSAQASIEEIRCGVLNACGPRKSTTLPHGGRAKR